MENNGYSTNAYNTYTSLQNQLPTPPGSDTAYSPDQNGYYSPEQIAADALSYQQCMQSSENAQIPTTTVLHQPVQQLAHPINLSPVNQQVSPPHQPPPQQQQHHQQQQQPQQQLQPQQVSPVQGSVMTSNLTSNLTPPTQLNVNTLFMRMQQDARSMLPHCTVTEQQRLLLQEQETARRLSHMGNITGNIASYGQTLPTIDINRVGKKRKMVESPGQPIKTEPGGKGQPEHEYSDVDQETSENYRSLPWNEYNKDKWTLMLDANCRPITDFKYTVSADKGFVHQEAHSAFISQKKNHFQVTVTAYGFNSPKFVKTENNVSEIRAFYIRLFGFKNESKNQIIPINQSTVERQKYCLEPQRVDFHNGSLTKTIPRLHFSATTENNMRKKGKPNPNQRFFSLVVSLEAETTSGQKHCLAACISERIIVRASSPSNFDLEQQLWERVDNSSIRYMGNVGINIERPEHATLAVGGNVLVSGSVNHYSDQRVKENIQVADCSEELQKVRQLNLYNYSYTEEFCEHSKIDDPQQFGVIAQEVQRILPDAVKNNGTTTLESGSIENVLTVNKDRIYMAGVGAVKELSGITDNIIDKIDELEQVNTNLVDRFKRKFGSKSTLNSSFKKKRSIFSSTDSLKSGDSVRRTLRLMQKAVCALSGVVVLCLAAIVCLFVVMHHNAKIVSSHHNVLPHQPDSKINTEEPQPQQSVTVTRRLTYGPDEGVTEEPHVNLFGTMGCDVTAFPGLSSSDIRVQYSRTNKRLDCKYSVDLSPEEYFLKTNANHFTIDITPATRSMMSQQCQSRTSPCGPSNNIYIIGKAGTNKTVALAKATRNNTPTKKVQGSHQRYSYLLVSGMNKIQARVRVLPGHVACKECCHVSQGTFLDIHYYFTFKCPSSYNDISDYKIGPST